jgi:hypothetical protein
MGSMSVTQAEHVTQSVIKGLIAELEELVDTKGQISNDDIVGSFQNVVMLDYGMKVEDLPGKLQDLYNRSRIVREKRHRLDTLRFDLDHLSRKG